MSMKNSLIKKQILKLIFFVHIKVWPKDGVQDLFLREGKYDRVE